MNHIQQFQLQNGLTADGILGKKTLLKIKEVLQITSNESLAHFIGQTAHETGNFSLDTENLNYSAKGLLSTFKKYFPTEDSTNGFAKNPEKIANKVYANRMGNGDEKSGDGFKYRGRGALQLTGKSNYQLFAKYVNDDDVVRFPELINSKYFFQSAKYFFDKNKIWKQTNVVDEKSITAVSKIINGGTNGLDDRIAKTLKYYEMLSK